MPERRAVARRSGRRNNARGVVLVALLLALALGGLAVMAAADVWWLARQREREQQLLFVGDQYRLAIQRYYYGAPPGARRALPARLDDLLEDDRYPVPVRHLRRLYPDPITGSADWGLLRVGERIAGVHSRSDKPPIKQAGFAQVHEHFSNRSTYSEWVFAAAISGLPRLTNPSSSGAPVIDGVPAPTPRPDRRAP